MRFDYLCTLAREQDDLPLTAGGPAVSGVKSSFFPRSKIQRGESHSVKNIITVLDIVVGGELLISGSKGKR